MEVIIIKQRMIKKKYYCNSWSHSSGVLTEQNWGDERHSENNVIRHLISISIIPGVIRQLPWGDKSMLI